MERPDATGVRWNWRVAVLAAALAVGLGAWFALRSGDEPPDRSAARAEAEGHVAALVKFVVADGVGSSKPWPPYEGKRFLLWLVASGRLDRRSEAHLSLLFSPADATRSLAATGVAAFAGVTNEALDDPTFDVGRLTSLLGPRDDDPAPDPVDGRAIVADLSFRDVAIVGYASGAVRTLTKVDLGLQPGEPIVAGPTARHAALRALGE